MTERWRAEPLLRLRRYLEARGIWSEREEEQLANDCAARAEEAAQDYLKMPPQPPETMFDFLHERLPDALIAQRAAVRSGDASDD